MNNMIYSDFVESKTPAADIIFVENRSTMIDFTDDLYRIAAQALTKHIGCSEFYSGTIHIPCEGFCASLTVTLIVRYEKVSIPEGVCTTMCDIVPVWWQMDTTLDNGDGALNNFSFKELKQYIF